MKNEIKHLILREMMPEDSAGDRLPYYQRQGYAKEATRASDMTLRNVFTDAEGEKILVYVIRREQWRKQSRK